MSFTPLPEPFLRDLERCRARGRRILDLGCGGGEFFAGIDPGEALVVGLDRLGPGAGMKADVVGDALSIPFGAAGFDLVVAANLFRHIVSQRPAARILETWLALLRAGGALYLFEDEPCSETPAVRNYRDVQEFLLALMPASRGPLLPLREFRNIAGTDWNAGTERNRHPIDARAVCRMLVGDGRPGRRTQRLIRAIGNEGIDCGTYWWAYRRNHEATERTP